MPNFKLKQTSEQVQKAIDNSLNPDKTLNEEGVPADAQAVGEELKNKYSAENEPPYPVESVCGKTGAVSLTAGDVGADPSGRATGLVDAHNISGAAHNDIRLLISGLTTRLNALADSDDTTLDQLSEIVEYIKANKSLIDSITTSKVSVADIIDNLTTSVSNKPLSAKMGVELRRLISVVENRANNAMSDAADAMNRASYAEKTASDALRVASVAQPAGDYPTREELPELVEEILREDEFSETGEVVELAVEEGTPLEVVSKIHRDSTWGLSDKLVLHQVSGSNFVDMPFYIGEVGTVFTNSGITATINADNTITIAGTNELDSWNNVIKQDYGSQRERVYPAGTYTVASGFNVQVCSAQYPDLVDIPGVPVNVSGTFTIPEPFVIKRFTYAVRAKETVNVTLPLGIFGGTSIPEAGYAYSGIIHTVEFDRQVYEGEFNWRTGELKDADGNTVAYYDANEIVSLPGTNHFWTGFGENTVLNAPGELEKVVETVEKLQESVAGIEYHTITTDLAYAHEGLPLGKKTVDIQSDGALGNDCYAYAGKDLIVRKTFNRKFPYNGITITRNGITYHVEGTTTTSTDVYFALTVNNVDHPIDKELVGKKLRITTFSDTIITTNVPNIGVRFVDTDGKIVNIVKPDGTTGTVVAGYIGKDTLARSFTVTVPEGAASVQARVAFPANAEYNFNFQFYLTEDELTSSVSVSEPTPFGKGLNVSDVLTFPYQSIITVEAPIDEYVKYMARNAKGDKATYLTPESFGAVGDGYADDSEAIALCLAMAAETKQTVLMAKKYVISSPIVISYDGLNIIANDIVYTGSDTAIKISGQKNTFKIHSIQSSGLGISYRADNNKFVCHNDVEVNTIVSTSHGIVFYNGLRGVYQNTVRFDYIKAGGNGTYGICELTAEGGSYVTENNFYGGQISNCDWAVYCIEGNSKCYSIQVEGNVKGGFYINGAIHIFAPRWAESSRDGEYPFFKIKLDTGHENFHIYSEMENFPINEFDVSENTDIYIGEHNGGQPIREKSISVYHGQIGHPKIAVGSDERAYYGAYSRKTYIWGSQMIFTPWMDYSKRVTTEEFDTRRIGSADLSMEEARNLGKLPTKFIVDNVDTTIHLHASYCCIGYSKFEVVQANGFTCKIYNSLGNLVFDGSEYGDGTYRVSVQNDCDLSISTPHAAGMLNKTLAMEVWNVEPVLTMDILRKISGAAVAT